MQDDCALPTKHMNILLVCLSECVSLTAVKSSRPRLKEREMQNERKVMISIKNSLACAAVWRHGSWKRHAFGALTARSAQPSVTESDGFVPSPLPSEAGGLCISVCCEVQTRYSKLPD